MKITRNMKSIAAAYPAVSLLGYRLLKKVWQAKAAWMRYDYPSDASKATVSLEMVKDYNKNRPFGPRKKICYAPFTNMHFQMNGDVSACSFNYDYTIGNVHRQTVKEIWFGEKADSFRTTLANYNLDKCLSCKKVIYSGNYSSFPPLKYDIHGLDDVRYPTQMSFEISNLCNYECIMCNEDFSSLIRKNRMKLPPLKSVYPENFLEQLKEFIPHLEMATFIGGEPLLIKTYFDIWEAILRDNATCTIHIQTNGSYLPPAFLQMLETGRFEIGVSIDAPDKETFEKVRINANFEEVEANIKVLLGYKEKGKIFMNFNFCPLTVNWHTLPAMIQYANEADVALKIVNVETPRHLALQYRSSSYLQQVYDTLRQQPIKISRNSIHAQRNLETYHHFLKTVEAYLDAALRRETVSRSLAERYDIAGLFQQLNELMQTNLLFNKFTPKDKSYLFDEIKKYLELKGKPLGDEVIRQVIIRIILSYQEAEHEVDNAISTDVGPGLMMYKRVVDEFLLLEDALQQLSTSP